MSNTIKVMPNQDMLDVILQGCGSLESAAQFCEDNKVAISDIPLVGKEYILSDAALRLGGATAVKYLRLNGIVIGTLGSDPEGYITDDGSDLYGTDDGTDAYTPE